MQITIEANSANPLNDDLAASATTLACILERHVSGKTPHWHDISELVRVAHEMLHQLITSKENWNTAPEDMTQKDFELASQRCESLIELFQQVQPFGIMDE